MNALIVRLRLLEPVLATQPQIGEPNSGVSLGYIAGSMMRGATVAGFLALTGNQGDGDLFHRLFLSGAVRFLHAYPEGPHTGSRMLPKPLSWLVEKDKLANKEEPIFDAACKPPALANPKSPPGEFAWWGAEHVELSRLKRQQAVHTAGDDRNRKAEGSSQVYRYEALAPGQTLVAAIVAEDAADLEQIAPALRRINKIGGSRTGGYGGVAVESVKPVALWREYTPAGERSPVNHKEAEFLAKHIVVTLLSDAVLRTADGQVGASLDEYLHQQWGLPQPLAAFGRLRLVGGFNRTAGLPLAQAWAVEAGSVLVYARTPQVEAALAPLAASGVGERLAEGFGRLALDWQAAEQIQQRPCTPVAAEPSPVKLVAAGQAMAALMASRQIEARVQESLVSQVSRLMQGFQHLPSAAQLSRAQLAARRACAAADLTLIDQHFAGLNSANAQWRDAAMHGQNLRKWIGQQTQLSPEDFAQQFGLVEQLPNVAGVPAELTKDERDRAVARLIEEVLRQAVKAKKRAAEEPASHAAIDTVRSADRGATSGTGGRQRQ